MSILGRLSRPALVALALRLALPAAASAQKASADPASANPASAGQLIAKADAIAKRVATLRGLALKNKVQSGVMNKAFCRAAKRLGSGDPDGQATADSVRRAGKAFFLANESYWTASTNFTQGCQGVMDAATALGMTAAERDALLASWLYVGVYCDGCRAGAASRSTRQTSARRGSATRRSWA